MTCFSIWSVYNSYSNIEPTGWYLNSRKKICWLWIHRLMYCVKLWPSYRRTCWVKWKHFTTTAMAAWSLTGLSILTKAIYKAALPVQRFIQFVVSAKWWSYAVQLSQPNMNNQEMTSFSKIVQNILERDVGVALCSIVLFFNPGCVTNLVNKKLDPSFQVHIQFLMRGLVCYGSLSVFIS